MGCCFGARILIMGWAATPNVGQGGGARGKSNPNRVPTNLIMMKGLHIIGCPAAISLTADKDGSMLKRRLRDLNDWLSNGRLPPPVVSSTFPLTDIKSALKTRVASGLEVGATIVRPAELNPVYSSKL